jgi:hypothetical protein
MFRHIHEMCLQGCQGLGLAFPTAGTVTTRPFKLEGREEPNSAWPSGGREDKIQSDACGSTLFAVHRKIRAKLRRACPKFVCGETATRAKTQRGEHVICGMLLQT